MISIRTKFNQYFMKEHMDKEYMDIHEDINIGTSKSSLAQWFRIKIAMVYKWLADEAKSDPNVSNAEFQKIKKYAEISAAEVLKYK